jgi:hypothetical protein
MNSIDKENSNTSTAARARLERAGTRRPLRALLCARLSVDPNKSKVLSSSRAAVVRLLLYLSDDQDSLPDAISV